MRVTRVPVVPRAHGAPGPVLRPVLAALLGAVLAGVLVVGLAVGTGPAPTERPSSPAWSSAGMSPVTAVGARPVPSRRCRQGVQVLNREALRPWWNALRVHGSRRADVLLVGDSITEGVGTDWEGRLAARLQRSLRRDHPLPEAQGAGHLPAAGWSGLRVPGLRRVGPGVRRVDTHGLGAKALAVPAGSAVELAFTGTRVRVWWGTRGGGSPGTASLDGGPPVPMPGSLDRPASGLSWLSPELPAGSHRLRVAAGPGRVPLLVEGFEVLGSEADRTAGVHVHDGSHGGWSSHGWVPALGRAAVRHWEAAAALAPDLTVVDLGVNDWFWHTTPRQLRSNLEAVVASAVAADDGPHAVLLVVPYRVVRDPARWPPGEWGPLRRTILGMAGGDVAVLDLGRHWPRLRVGSGHDSGLMLEDRHPVHPNPRGHRRIARLVAAALAPDAEPALEPGAEPAATCD